jgi:hypothetical protein
VPSPYHPAARQSAAGARRVPRAREAGLLKSRPWPPPHRRLCGVDISARCLGRGQSRMRGGKCIAPLRDAEILLTVRPRQQSC